VRDSASWGLPLLVVILAAAHFVLRVGMDLGNLAPDLLVVAVLLAARTMRAGRAALLGLVLGMLEGSLIPFGLGSVALALTVVGYAGARSRDLFASEGPVTLGLYFFGGKLLFDVLLSLVSGAAFGPEVTGLLVLTPLTALYAAVTGVLVFATYRALT
jgi:cell shape-determining protein MreD